MKNLLEMVELVRGKRMKIAVGAAEDEEVLKAVARAKEEEIVDPVLFGKRKDIETLVERMNLELEAEIVHVEDPFEAVRKAVESVSRNETQILMKGKIKTSDLFSVFLKKEYGLRTGRTLSAVSVHEVPGYHKILIISDGGLVISPNLQQRMDIVENSILVARALGIEKPKIALLGTGDLKSPLTLEIAALSKIFQQRNDCIVDGPLTLDLAISEELASKAGNSPVAGDADILIVPSIETGNILSKSLVYMARGRAAIVVVGGRVPVVLTSRADDEETRFLSIALSVLVAQKKG
ncbi:phosphate butyryltransferase [Thermotoga maritima MSB8]|nr:phosphate acyltransferase [Thermotoga maritima]AGL50687.1 Phosphate butyryltransferase [Thermotoga maritima MSB8]AHD18351.1 phosphate butyryltransferase [Thermotoga maritima MSB8]AKE27637.1 phosphate butyryltransferase [Thermotoga maritima]AKE29510.1 phosphate butyryltransferase [Thermotoga maritima MSB8]AKE31381.1 phosphate butyryltransferase [Thermotoga maritima]